MRTNLSAKQASKIPPEPFEIFLSVPVAGPAFLSQLLMASRYDTLDARRQLEQTIAAELDAALGPRGATVTHNGSATAHAPGGMADIEIVIPSIPARILVEVTRRKGSAADGEFIAVTDHLTKAVQDGGYQFYGALYISPATSARMSLQVGDYFNRLRETNGDPGRVVAIDFATLQEAVDRWQSTPPPAYPAERLRDLFDAWESASDDQRARKLVAETLFTEDTAFAADADEALRIANAKNEQGLRKAIEQIENELRQLGVTGNHANSTLVHLTFIRLFEEKRQQEHALESRFTERGFVAWSEGLPQQVQGAHTDRLVNYLMHEIAADPDLSAAGLLHDASGAPVNLHPRVTDSYVREKVLRRFDEYRFYNSTLDVLGVVFETLARKSEKDTRVGQFFTPQEVVDACVRLVGLKPTDLVLDPAAGTARFLIAAMYKQLEDAAMLALPIPQAEAEIKQNHLYGADIDDWVATIAKMNMYVHGDGKSNVASANGLVLADRPVFLAFPSGVAGEIDVVLTNPPLGDASYLVARDDWLRRATANTTPNGSEFLYSLGVVPLQDPGPTVRQKTAARLQERVNTATTALAQAATQPEGKERERLVKRLERSRTKALDQLTELSSLPPEPPPVPLPTGRVMKGGALFLGAIRNYLKTHRNPALLPEWQGGRTAIVVDEAILNTADYAEIRRFIRQEFYVKAVISLGREAFTYLAKTDAKTSVLFLVRKADPAHQQTEPIFFGHAERCGYSRTGRWVGSDLPGLLDAYEAFQSVVHASYSGPTFSLSAFKSAASLAPETYWRAPASGADLDARLDYFKVRADVTTEELTAAGVSLVSLGDLLEPREPANPAPDPDNEYDTATVDRRFGVVRDAGRTLMESYKANDLWLVEEGDIVVSGIDLVNGAIGIARANVAGRVMSKEMFPLRVKSGVDLVPEYAALLLRTETARKLIQGATSGTSNRTRVTVNEVLSVVVPQPPDSTTQQQHAAVLAESEQKLIDAQTLAAQAKADLEAAWTQP